MSNQDDPIVDVELALLYSVLQDPRQIHAARSIVSAADFTGGRGLLFGTVVDIADEGQDHTDVVAICKRMKDNKTLDRFGGVSKFSEVSDVAATASNALAYARQIRIAADRRRAIKLTEQTLRELNNPSRPLDATLTESIDAMTRLGSRSTTRAAKSIYEAGLDVLRHLDDTDASGGVLSGIPAIDESFGQFNDGTLTTIAARTSIGKSGLCLQIANNVALSGGRVLYFSMEMPAIELAYRCLGNAAGVCSQAIANRAVDTEDRVRLVHALDGYRDAGLAIDDSPNQTAASIASSARAMKASDGLDAMVIDHVGLIGYPAGQKRHEAIADASRSFKRLAKELSVPVFMACQINRKGDESGESRPRLSHLADSTSIENDSDNVIILHRNRPTDPITTFAFEKVRNGQKGVRQMRMDLPSTWFVDDRQPSVTPHDAFAEFT